MASRSDDIDDDFSDIYKEYTGPPRLTADNAQERTKQKKRSNAGSDEEEARDPNAVPTDFTSREAKVWEAKSKATERNWKKRKEEEMICKICGESGHFTQGCPSTLGANRKSQDFIERIAARENHVKALFSDKVVRNIEKDTGCKIKIEEKFIIVSGKDRLILAKGVDAAHKVIEQGNKRGSSGSRINKSRSPERSPVNSRLGRSTSQRSLPSPQNASKFQQRVVQHEKVVEDRVRDDLLKMSKSSSEAYGKDGGRSHSSQSKSPARPTYKGNSYNSNDHGQTMGVYGTDGGWDAERRGLNIQLSDKFEYPAFPRTLEELEVEYKKEAMELGRIRDKEEDEENYKHRETVLEIRESYMKKLAILRGLHAKQWEEFVEVDARMRQRAHQQMPPQGYISYKEAAYPPYEGSAAAAARYTGAGLNIDPRGKYPNSMEKFPPSRPHDSYGDFQRQRRDDYGKAYNRF